LTNEPLVVYCLHTMQNCPLQNVLAKAMRHTPQDTDGNVFDTILGMTSGIAGRVLRAYHYTEEGFTEVWIRVSGASSLLEAFENKLKQEEGIAFQKIFSNKFNTVYRIILESDKCQCIREGRQCPLLRPMPGSMVKTTIITPYGILCELIVAKSKVISELKRKGCKVLLSHEINGYNYMLTQKQELAILYAYIMGYYQFPRRTSLKELAAKLDLSVSTLAELLRKAEAKVIEAFLRHELPHYLVGLVMNKNVYRDLIESHFDVKNKAEEKSEEKKPVILAETK
jgi:predicted DNA binding protein